MTEKVGPIKPCYANWIMSGKKC